MLTNSPSFVSALIDRAVQASSAQGQEVLRRAANQEFGERRASQSWGIAALAVRHCKENDGTNTSLNFISMKATKASLTLQQKMQPLIL